jgi:RNA polymerase sigma-54 factor
MSFEQRIDLRLTQKLALTPQLQLHLKLLQLPQLELNQYIQLELMENPLLELEEEESQVLEIETSSEEKEPLVIDKIEKIIIDDYFSERANDGRDLGYFNPGLEEKPNFETFLSQKMDLWEHLNWQLRLSNAEKRIRHVAEIVIGNIDEDGYLKASDEEIAQHAMTDLDTVKEAIMLIQDFDPPGVASRDLKECLLLQLKALGLENSIVSSMITNHLEDIQKKKYGKLSKIFNITIEEVLNALKIIEKLDPRPGRNFAITTSSPLIPDVYVKKVDNEYQIILNDEGIPKIKLNNFYREMFNAKKVSSEERVFLKEKLRRAIDLLKGLEQRNKTIYRVTESLVNFQIEFFGRGVKFLKPLTLKDLAKNLGLHESTISRVTSNKYLACDHGVFSFKFFFNNALPSKDGVVSTSKVKELIRKVIEEENPEHPLSDIEIVEILKKEGINIARRTVAKYREELKLPSKSLRRGIKRKE